MTVNTIYTGGPQPTRQRNNEYRLASYEGFPIPVLQVSYTCSDGMGHFWVEWDIVPSVSLPRPV